jgi:hypothetical protein
MSAAFIGPSRLFAHILSMPAAKGKRAGWFSAHARLHRFIDGPAVRLEQRRAPRVDAEDAGTARTRFCCRRRVMYRTMLAGVAAIALMAGAAYADDYSSQTTTTVAPAAPAPANSYSKSKTVKHTDAFGNQSEQHDSVSKSQAMTPDGDSTTVTHAHSDSSNDQ